MWNFSLKNKQQNKILWLSKLETKQLPRLGDYWSIWWMLSFEYLRVRLQVIQIISAKTTNKRNLNYYIIMFELIQNDRKKSLLSRSLNSIWHSWTPVSFEHMRKSKEREKEKKTQYDHDFTYAQYNSNERNFSFYVNGVYIQIYEWLSTSFDNTSRLFMYIHWLINDNDKKCALHSSYWRKREKRSSIFFKILPLSNIRIDH